MLSALRVLTCLVWQSGDQSPFQDREERRQKKITSLRLRAPQHPGVQMLQMIKVRQVIWLKDELPTHGDSKAAHCSRCLQIWCPAQRLALVLASIFHAICSFFRWPFGRRASASFCCVFASHWIEWNVTWTSYLRTINDNWRAGWIASDLAFWS